MPGSILLRVLGLVLIITVFAALTIAATDKAEGGLAGAIASYTYLGDKCEYAVDLGGILLQVTKANPQPSDRLPPGAAVRLHLPAADIQLL